MESILPGLRVISTILLVMSFIQFLLVGLILRPRRMQRYTKITGEEVRWGKHAGHTVEQRIFQTAVIESILGTGILIALKLNLLEKFGFF